MPEYNITESSLNLTVTTEAQLNTIQTYIPKNVIIFASDTGKF